MAGYLENTSLQIQPFSDAQASILDFLFPGFTRMSAVAQGYLTIDLNAHVPLLCFFGLLAFVCRRISGYLLRWLETRFISTVHVPWRTEAYDMAMVWVSSQSFAKHARSFLVTTELTSSSTPGRQASGGDTNKRTLYYTPWNGRFFFRYNGHLLVFRRDQTRDTFNSREEVSVSYFSKSPQILKELLNECCIEYSKLVQNKTSIYEHQVGSWTRSALADIRHISTVFLSESRREELLQDIRKFLDPTAQKWYSNRGIPYRRVTYCTDLLELESPA